MKSRILWTKFIVARVKVYLAYDPTERDDEGIGSEVTWGGFG